MNSEDPFFMVRNEVSTALEKSNRLLQQWKELKLDNSPAAKDELHGIAIEIRNVLRLIDWDLEDLEEAMSILEANPKKFKVDDDEIARRKQFINKTKSEVNEMKEEFESRDNESRMANFNGSSSLNFSSIPGLSGNGTTKYARLENELESPTSKVYNETTERSFNDYNHGSSNLIIKPSNHRPDNRDMNGTVIDERAIMLDDFFLNSSFNDSKFDNKFKNWIRTFELTTPERKKMTAIGLSSFLVVFILIFAFF